MQAWLPSEDLLLVWRKIPEQIALITEVMQGLTLSGFTNASYLLAHDSILNYLPVSGLNTHIVYAEQARRYHAQARHADFGSDHCFASIAFTWHQ